jgi:hypothetical protein
MNIISEFVMPPFTLAPAPVVPVVPPVCPYRPGRRPADDVLRVRPDTCTLPAHATPNRQALPDSRRATPAQAENTPHVRAQKVDALRIRPDTCTVPGK